MNFFQGASPQLSRPPPRRCLHSLSKRRGIHRRNGDKAMVWQQIYDPFGNMFISTALAAVPVVVMLVALGFMHIKAHIAAAAGLVAALAVAVFGYGMPFEMAGRAAMYGGFTGLLPIGWIVLNIIFLQQLAEQNGSFKVLQDSLSGITKDRRLQLLLIAFCFGA
ncbi:MAG TPA: L-lactate permease, partial [Steroidobacteraceae bacterium]